ncbi:ribonuclease Z [Salegentibacter sp. F188]|uniref:Ribonuclease Z n=1 Tax=Autumnicola patrickiae TaxID=3075591 RepID=A0ABU3E3V7_9FLAO|nr:ribonuclease Z [Salegentibacter sp. F188]MDT0690683.1 ribonuclease Z [Salegentibacter sp. F188]
MKTIEKNNYLLIENDQDSITEFTSYLTTHHNDFRKKNVVVNLEEYTELQLDEILGFLELSNVHKNGKRSFVIVNNALHMDKVPEELMVVPTLQEAEDVIQMEEVQRDLGF